MFCTECGATLNSGAKFCGKCGTAISLEEQEENNDLNQKNQQNISAPSSTRLNDQGKYDPGLASSRQGEAYKQKNGGRKGMYLYTVIFTLIAYVLKGGGAYGIAYVIPLSLILLALIRIPNKVIRWFLFILFGAFFWLIVLFPST